MTYCVGLTGGIATGKSTISHYFEQLSVPVIDADQIAHDLLTPDTTCYHAVVDAFGSEVLNQDTSINRAWLRQQIFTSQDKKHLLESILHPAIRQSLFEQADTITAPYCILSIPLLIETHMQNLVDRILVINASADKQLERLLKRDGIDETLAQQMINQQTDRESRLRYADDIVDNNGDKTMLKQQVEQLHQQYLRLATQHG